MIGEETTDELRRYGLRLIQPASGYRFSLDPLLLAAFVGSRAEKASVIDLGAGCGVIPLILAAGYGASKAVGVEFQSDLFDIAARNVALNNSAGRVEIICSDILHLRNRFAVSTFDVVVANPPYRKPGTGRISPRAGRDVARHESTAGLADFLSAAKYLVKPGGAIFFVYHPSRMAEFISSAGELKLAPVRLRMVHGTKDADAGIFLAELVKGRKADLVIMPPLVIYGENGEYTTDAEGILGIQSALSESCPAKRLRNASRRPGSSISDTA